MSKWISCKDRMPDKREMVIVWIDKPPMPFAKRSDNMAFAWREPDARSGELRWMDRHFTDIKEETVLAWMPLPESYHKS